MTTEYLDKLILLSIQKKNLLEKFLEKTKLQKEVIENEEMDKLEKVLLDKDEIISDIDKMDIIYLETYGDFRKKEGIDSIKEIDINKYGNLKQLKEVTVEVSDLLSKIDLLDRENIKLIKDKVGNVKSELKNVKSVQTAYKGYNNQDISSVLIDERK